MFNWFRNWGNKTPKPVLNEDVREELAQKIVAMANENKLTPDINKLGHRRAQLLFVGDEMMDKRPRHDLLQEYSVPLGRCFTQGNFTHIRWEPEGKGQSVTIPLTRQYNTVPYLPIQGELYAVLPNHFTELDKYKRSVGYFDRKRVKLTYVHRRTDYVAFPLYEEIDAHMYIGVDKYWAERMDNGYEFRPVGVFGKNKGEGTTFASYSYYSKTELNESFNSS